MATPKSTIASPRKVKQSSPRRGKKSKVPQLKEIPQTPIPKPVPIFTLNDAVKANPPDPKNVFVIAPGSECIRYGFSRQSNPETVRTVVAYRRKSPQQNDALPWSRRDDSEVTGERGIEFEETVDTIVEERTLEKRRRGMGRPIPWRSGVEEIESEDTEVDYDWKSISRRVDVLVNGNDEVEPANTIIGEYVDWIPDDDTDKFDIVSPIREAHVDVDRYGSGLACSALDSLIQHAVLQIAPERKEQSFPIKCEMHVILVVSEITSRRDIEQYCAAIFRCRELGAAAVFVHHESVTCTFGAGLATAAVVNVGQSSTTICCIDEGIAVPDSRLRLGYGGQDMFSAYWKLLDKKKVLEDPLLSKLRPHERRNFVRKSIRKIGTFSSDSNDGTVGFKAALPTCRLRLDLGVAFACVPMLGFFHPSLYARSKPILAQSTILHNTDDDNYFSGLFDDLKRSTAATAAVPFGTFSNDVRHEDDLKLIPPSVHPFKASITEALIWSINKAAVASHPNAVNKQSDLTRRLFGSVLLTGGGSNVTDFMPSLEQALDAKMRADDLVRYEITVFYGRSKVDEELAAAAAVVKGGKKVAGLDDDGDAASLPWKGGAVIAQAEAISEMWIYRDEWESKGDRIIRERTPFYW